MPAYLELVGRPDEAAARRKGITRRHVGSGALLGSAVAVLVTAMVGSTVAWSARSYDERALGTGMAIGGGVVGLLSLGGSFGLAGDARRLRWDFPSAFDSGVQSDVARHNERLRDQLRLGAADVAALDAMDRRAAER